MNKKTGLLLFSLAILLAVPFAVLGIDAPHDMYSMTGPYYNNVGCLDASGCHKSSPPEVTGPFNNVCTSCHFSRQGSPIISPFVTADASNIYNRFGLINYTTSNKMWSSHSWGGGSEVAPQAGAGHPKDKNMISGIVGTKMSCIRCHDPHSPRDTNYPFLRANNSDDNMCRDCHSARDHSPGTTNQFGTHPVNFRYTSAGRKTVTNRDDYYDPPRNANPDNTKSAMLMKNGNVQCTTCHGVHYADSNSRHPVGRDSYPILSSSRGMLLRTDTFGQTDAKASVNICTNCHQKPNHQAYSGSRTRSSGINKMAGIQCVDCHTGHVEYIKDEDKALGGENNSFNIYLLRRYMNYSAGFDPVKGIPISVKLDTYRRKAFLTTTSSSAELRNGSGTRICETCHNLPNDISQHSTATTKNECLMCHGSIHSLTPPLRCDGCHGYPPRHDEPGTNRYGINPSNGYAVYSGNKNYKNSLVYKNESTSGHPTHAGNPYNLDCIQCHKLPPAATHNNNQYQDVRFTEKGAYSLNTVFGTYFTPGASISTCTNVYCHSYGMATLTKAKTVYWAAGMRDKNDPNNIAKSTARCVKCHNGVSGGYDNMSTNAHYQHVSKIAGKGIGCNICHAATVSDNDTIISFLNPAKIAKTNHVNGKVDLAIGGTSNMTGKYNDNTIFSATLSGTTACNTYCHSDGTGGDGAKPKTDPKWTDRSTGKCNTCHYTATSLPAIASNGHYKHISSASGPKLAGNNAGNNSCIFCHDKFSELGPTHVNGTVDVNKTAGTCNMQCHRNGTPIWSSRSDGNPDPLLHRLECSSCHDGQISYDTRPGFNSISAPRKSMLIYSTMGHGQMSSAKTSSAGAKWPASRYKCTDCHDSDSRHISGVRGDTRRLTSVNDTSSVAGFSTGSNNLCITCHNSGAQAKNLVRPTHYAFKNQTTPTMQCAQCHDAHGSVNLHMVAKTISFHPDSSAYKINYVSKVFVQYSAPYRGLCQICHTKTNHFRRGQSNFDIGGGSSPHSGYNAISNTNCLGCHQHGTGQSAKGNAAFKPAGCNICHGYPPVPINSIPPMGRHNNYSTAGLQNYSGGGGVHAVAGHLPASVKASNGWNADCNKCHYSPDQKIHIMDTSRWFVGNSTANKKSRVTVKVDPQYKFNSIKTLDEHNYIKAAPASSGQCTNVSCHFQPSPKWGGAEK